MLITFMSQHIDKSDEKSDKEDSHMEDDSPDPPDSDATT